MAIRPRRPRRVISIGHSYCVGLNRRLAHEIAREGRQDWEVTAVAPTLVHGELRSIPLEEVADEPVRLEPVPVRFSRRIHFLLYGTRLRELLREPWDLVHAWEEPYVLAGGQVALWTPKATPFVFWTAQNLDKSYPPPFSWVERYCLERCAGWMACGQSTLETMLERGYGRKPHRVTALGVDLERFAPDAAAKDQTRSRLGWNDPGPPVVGYLGRFVAEKGLGVLMRSLEEGRSPWRALIVGGGPMESELRAWAKGQGDRVRIVTGVKHDDVPAYLNAMDLLLAPSQTVPWWREQLGRMVLEAFACGVPVVASDSGELPWVVADAGLIVPEAEVSEWTRVVEELLEDAPHRRELANRGRERAHEEYAWPIIARQHLEFFEQLLDQHDKAAASRAAALPLERESSAPGQS